MRTDKSGRTYKPGVVARLNGQRFGLLTVLHRSGNKGKFAAWLCRCDCGVEVIVGGNKLRDGRRTKCSAAAHRALNPPSLTVAYKSEYQSWTSMRARCLDPKNKKYSIYGGRGITIDQRWNDFKNFMLDMGRKPDPKFTIERDNVNGNYEPTNCRWISRKDQGRNKRNSVFVTYNGKKMLLIDLVEELGLSRNIVYQRLKLGWTLAQAIAIPLGAATSHGRPRGPARKPYKKRQLKKIPPSRDPKVMRARMEETFLRNLKEMPELP